ncbi:MAG: diguanylate cyclase [Actinomycetota bacterium]|nr:diguanylate cyclase [Actinomycetota bacterium]
MDAAHARARRLGHDAAEIALQRTGSALEHAKRTMDAAGRIGGQEFAFVLPDTDQHGAYVVAERLRVGVAQDTSDLQMPVQGSFGVACFPEHGKTREGC